jgi:16S rRNA (cytidine1402-2'-O)-methyltransferase
MNRIKPDKTGTLYVVGTPIGNLGDIGERARDVLGRVDLIAAEDTRRTGRLLSRIGVQSRLYAYHEHNEGPATDRLVEELLGGADVALVTDAGMPLISDPGWRLVRAAREHDIDVRTVPGPCAVSAALSIAGLPTDRYVFEGFLPRRKGQRDRRLRELARETRTLVFFESVHRLEGTIRALERQFGGEREAAVARELTKLHEAVHTGPLSALVAALGREIPLLGEFVIVVAGANEVSEEAVAVERVYSLLAEVVDPDVAVGLCARITGVSRNAVYSLTRRRH